MAIKLICDKCEHEFKGKTEYVYIRLGFQNKVTSGTGRNNKSKYKSDAYDLCIGCFAKLRDFMKEK